MKNSQKRFQAPKGYLRARKTLQKFRYSVLEHMGALLSNIGLFLSKKTIYCGYNVKGLDSIEKHV